MSTPTVTVAGTHGAGGADALPYARRIARAREEMARRGVDALVASVGHDLPYLVGYHAMPLERLTALVVPREGEAVLVVPRLEAARVVPRDGVFALRPWTETQDPVGIVAGLLRGARTVAIGDETWARFLVDLLARIEGVRWVRGVDVVGPLRIAKDATEVAALRRAGAAADRVAVALRAGEIPLLGRSEAQVAAEISARLLAEGHDTVNFAIVASGPHAASPHHEPGSRTIARGDIVLCDFGGTLAGYCSDITRCVHVGEPTPEVREAWGVLRRAQQAGVEAARVGAACESVDAAARRVIADAGWGEHFIHRVGHGIGMAAHEDPYMVEGNATPIVAGHAFSVEPGIYVEGRWGMRLEDIVVATDAGPERMNHVDRDLAVIG
jgi:Xaa-Pro aminopeptidase